MIYILEDDLDIRQLVVYTVNNTIMKCEGFENPRTFYDALQQELPELILLDLMLPEESGIDVLKKLKSNHRTKHIPVILLTAKSEEIDKVIGLDAGAEDYITKPFGMMELLARIRVCLRRNKKKNEKKLVFHDLVMDVEAYTAKIQQKTLELTRKEFDLLKIFLMSPNQVFTREQLLDIIWKYDYEIETRTVDVHIGSLRQKLGDYAKYIKTVRGIGYKFSGEMDD